ncbi:hypothetical protein DXG03_008063 [Asterophora parasitica]|uniref:Uncharacterized protein n=1 Tax=Asterophora parasitica TaxID=117018 RepID=A0A9P7G093_9AGAR|nr:hypothetical protein DXG03_008063 [Asterophora parasitica]
MTEYDLSPGAYDHYLATQRRIASWVDQTEGHRPEYGNVFAVQPTVVASESHISHSSQSTFAPPGQRSLRASQSQHFSSETPAPSLAQSSRTATRHRSSANLRSQRSAHELQTSQASAHPGFPSAGGPAYVYAPSGWAPSAGIIVIPPQNASPVAYASSTYQPSPTPVFPASAPLPTLPHGSYTQTVYPPAYAYLDNLHGAGVGRALDQVYVNNHTHTRTGLQPVIMPFLERERGGRSKSVDSRKLRKKGGTKGREKGGKAKDSSSKRTRSEVRGS